MSSETQPQHMSQRQGWTAGRIAGAVTGTVISVLGVLLILAAVAVFAAHAFGRDDDGFYSSGTERFESDGYAIATENIDLGTPADTAPDAFLGTVRVRGESTGDAPVFIGIGPRERVEEYLEGASHSILTDIDDPEYRDVAGGRLRGAPTQQSFWDAQASGRGEQTMEWEVDGGDWMAVMMNSDGSRPVSLDAGIAIHLDWLIWVAVGVLVVGIGLVGAGVALILVMRREANRPAISAAPTV
jgi:hypothetical protein